MPDKPQRQTRLTKTRVQIRSAAQKTSRRPPGRIEVGSPRRLNFEVASRSRALPRRPRRTMPPSTEPTLSGRSGIQQHCGTNMPRLPRAERRASADPGGAHGSPSSRLDRPACTYPNVSVSVQTSRRRTSRARTRARQVTQCDAAGPTCAARLARPRQPPNSLAGSNVKLQAPRPARGGTWRHHARAPRAPCPTVRP